MPPNHDWGNGDSLYKYKKKWYIDPDEAFAERGESDYDDDDELVPKKKGKPTSKSDTITQYEDYIRELEHEVRLLEADLEKHIDLVNTSKAEIKKLKAALKTVMAREEKGIEHHKATEARMREQIHALVQENTALKLRVGPDAVLYKRTMPELHIKRPYKGG